MDCKRAGKLLRAWIDGELPHDVAREAADHFRTCPACAALAEEGRRIAKAIRAGTPPATGLPRALDPAAILVRSRASAVEDSLSLIVVLKRVAAAAAVLLMASALLTPWLVSGSTPRHQPPRAYSTIATSAEDASMAAILDEDSWIVWALQRG